MSAAERKIIEDDIRAYKRAVAMLKDPERLAQVQKALGELSMKGGKNQ